MAVLNRSKSPELTRLPSGSFTVDPEGTVLASTLPQSFPAAHVREITQAVLACFKAARKANITLSELIADYAALKITARELRGGAIIFLSPHELTK